MRTITVLMAAKKLPRKKHVPQRTCVVCREKRDKRDLIRIVHTPDEGTVADPTGKRNGRGAYLCSQPSCWDKMLHSKVLDQALRTEVTPAEKTLLSSYRPKMTTEKDN
jgi:uncharacterized protein